ncbi:arginine/serine-rich coiled-coil protein 2 isoform X2 [Eupeodes corollae]|uniref:arginine/serine-rich coiled-coil protein 2 isoform X2 n=1 Tax=Eupeodes corollae TaxID=290404 RepID=UPI00249371F1|nr:arginine/serine-rich coiled-coil protein 2 isoform X2 [Eupeodes corollae]
MERIVNYSSEDECEDSPKRNVSNRDRSQGSSSHRDSKDTSLKKSSHKEENRSSRHSSNRDHHREDRRSERSHEKKRDSKDDRRRKDSHRERDRDYEHRETDRDRRDRSDKHRREKYSKDSSHREKGRRRRSSESPTLGSKDHNTSISRSRNRSRSRSPSKEQRTIPSIPQTGGRQQKDEPMASTSVSQSQNKSAINLQAILSPPLSDTAPKTSVVISKTDGTPIALPTYYNPNIINPTKYAEQVQKRKLIWGAKKAEDTSAKWGHATFSEDSDGKVASKFMRLMGIKSAPKPGDSPADVPAQEKKGPDVKSRQAMFSNMEQQYEVARQVTHTMRGVGLGFGSQSRQY